MASVVFWPTQWAILVGSTANPEIRIIDIRIIDIRAPINLHVGSNLMITHEENEAYIISG